MIVPLIFIYSYFIINAIIEYKIWNKKYNYYHFFRFLEIIALYISILTFDNNILTLAGLFLTGDFIRENLYNYLSYGYLDKDKEFKILKWTIEYKYEYNTTLFLIGIFLILIGG